MGKLIYSMLTSVDGYINRADRTFDWADPDDETLEFITARMRAVGTYLYGRRYYETMVGWANLRNVPGLKELDYRFSDLWNETPKWVYSTTLEQPFTANTMLRHEFDPQAIRELKETSAKHITVEGTQLAAACLRAGLVDGISVYVVPIVLGGGTPFYPPNLSLDLTLVDEERFASGILNLRYDVSN